MQRWIMAIVALVASLAVVPVVAQQSTPGPSVVTAGELGLPEIAIRVTDTAYEGIPSELAAGRYLLTVENATSQMEASVTFMQLAEGMTLQDFIAAFGPPPSGAAEGGTPAGPPPAAGSPPAEGGEDRPPDWYYQVEIAGGAYAAMSGSVGQAVIELTPGMWVVWAGYPGPLQMPVGVTVTGDMGATPAVAAEPPAAVTVDLYDFRFEVEGAIQPGLQWVKVVNEGEQPHEMIVVWSPVALTKEQVMQLVMLPEGATPPPGMPSDEEVRFLGGALTISSGKTEWVRLDLPEGTNVLLCFIPDRETGMPHAAMGMIEVVTVGGAATPTS